MVKYIGLLAIVLGSFHQVAGQSYNFINYGIGEGLAHEKVTDICEDQFGNLWLATAGGGASRFNGIEFKNVTIKDGLLSNYIRDILNDQFGNIWMATASGISKYDGKEIKNFVIDSTNEVNNSINVIYQGFDGSIWFSANEGRLGQIDTTEQIIYHDIEGLLSVDRIIDISQDDEGGIWFISAIQGLFKYDQGNASQVISNKDFKGYLLSVQKSEAGFLIGTNRGLVALDDETLTYDLLHEGSFIKNVSTQNEDSYWVVSSSGVLKSENRQLKPFFAKQGLTDKRINSVFIDREDNVWIGSDGDGLYKLTNEVIQFIGQQHGLTNLPVTSIVEVDSSQYWLGSFGNGISFWDGKNAGSLELPEVTNSYITALVKDQANRIFIGTRGSGLFIYDDGNIRQLNTSNGLINNIVRQLFVDSANRVWVGTLNGLSLIDNESILNFASEEGLADNLIWNFQEPSKGSVLIVTRKGFQFYKNGKLSSIDLEPDLFEKRINTAVQDENGNIWIGYSGHGIKRISPNGIELTYTSQDGLSSDLIYSLTFDQDGNLVVGTERGIDIITLDASNQVDLIKSFGQIEGFKNLQTAYGAVYKDGLGKIWYGVDHGVYVFNDQLKSINITQPITYISDIRLYYEDTDWQEYSSGSSYWMNIPQNLKLPYSKKNIIFDFYGTSLTNPYAVQYKYRLLGLDNKWSPITNIDEAVYSNLSPGSYTFEVTASNSDNVWAEPVQYSFTIVPPFWQRWWFYALSISAFIVLLKLFNDYRIRVNLKKILTVEKIRNEEQQKVRRKMARDFHDNLGNQLASISVFTNLISLKLKDRSKEIDDLLKSIEKHTSSLFTGTKDFIWSMDPDSDNLEEVYTYIKDFGEDLFEKTTIKFYANKDDDKLTNIPLPSGSSRQLVLIFKEAMTNALKHSGAEKVSYELQLFDTYFVMSLKDDGSGIVKEAKANSVGLKSMHSRAMQLKGTFEINSTKQGTEVLLRLPVMKKDKNSKTNELL